MLIIDILAGSFSEVQADVRITKICRNGGLLMNPKDHVCPYSKNPFCSSLNVADRSELCENCHQFPFHKNQNAEEKQKEIIREMSLKPSTYCTLILSGCVCTSKSASTLTRHALVLWEAGDIMHTQAIFGDGESMYEFWHYRFITDGCCAIFNADVLKKLFLSSVTFSTALFSSVTKTQERQTQFLLGTQLQYAREAIKFVLIYCKQNHYPPLTHEQIAYLCGLDRTTVTKMLKKIMQEDNLDISLHEYMKNMYIKE